MKQRIEFIAGVVSTILAMGAINLAHATTDNNSVDNTDALNAIAQAIRDKDCKP